jgi:hypothetical protein
VSVSFVVFEWFLAASVARMATRYVPGARALWPIQPENASVCEPALNECCSAPLGTERMIVFLPFRVDVLSAIEKRTEAFSESFNWNVVPSGTVEVAGLAQYGPAIRAQSLRHSIT